MFITVWLSVPQLSLRGIPAIFLNFLNKEGKKKRRWKCHFGVLWFINSLILLVGILCLLNSFFVRLCLLNYWVRSFLELEVFFFYIFLSWCLVGNISLAFWFWIWRLLNLIQSCLFVLFMLCFLSCYQSHGKLFLLNISIFCVLKSYNSWVHFTLWNKELKVY